MTHEHDSYIEFERARPRRAVGHAEAYRAWPQNRIERVATLVGGWYMCDRATAKGRRCRQTVSEQAAPTEPLVRRAAHAALEGLVEHLAERGVRVNGHRELAQVDAVIDGVVSGI